MKKSGVVLLLTLWLCSLQGLQAQTVNLVAPVNGYVGESSSVFFSWSALPGSVHYHLQVATDAAFTAVVQDVNLIPGDTLTISGFAPGTYYWKVRSFTGSSYTAWSPSRTFKYVNIQGVSSLALWWDPDFGVVQSGGAVSQWTDKSGQGHHGLQATSNRQPIITPNMLNGHPIVQFDGNLQYLKTLPFALTTPATIFLFYNKTDNGPIEYIFDGDAGDLFRYSVTSANEILIYCGNFYYYPNAGTPGYKIFDFRYNGSGSSVRQNFSTIGMAGNPGSSNPGGFTLGAYGSVTSNPVNHARVDVAEVIIFNDTIASSLTQDIEQYLRYKYAPPVNLGKDIRSTYSFCPVVISASAGYTSYFWSTGAVTPSITVSQPGDYWVQATDIFGMVSRDTLHVAYDYPAPGALADTSICMGDTLTWNTGYSHARYSFLWSDASADSLLQITQSGTYWYRITDSLGCNYYSDTVSVFVSPFPTASLGPDTTLCSGNVLLLDQYTGPGYAFNWSTSATDTLVTVTASGTYWVNAQNSLGCLAQDTVQITISGNAPFVDFGMSSSCIHAPVAFTDQSSSSNILQSWAWDFGDNTSSASQNPTHQYDSLGTYSVRLMVATDVGCSNDTTILVTVHDKPTAVFAYSDTCERFGTRFYNQSIANDGSITGTYWNFGDLSSTADTSSLLLPTYPYPTQGIYQPQLIAVNSYGCRDTVSQIIHVQQGPTAGFSYNKQCLNDPVVFTNLSTAGAPLTITSYKWNFTPTDSSVMISPTFTFTSMGSYAVSLLVGADNGCYHRFTDTLIIDRYVDAGFMKPQDSVCRYMPYTYLDTSLAINTTINSWAWRFDNNGNSSVQNPVFTFPDAGLQQIRLIVHSADNCVDSVKRTIFVKTPPTASFTVNPPVGVPPLNAVFTNGSSADVMIYDWDLGDGGSSSASNPVHQYTDTGSYIITLIVQDGLGCSDTAYRNILVARPSYNVLLQGLICTNANGYMQFTTTLLNQGNVALEQIDWRAGLNNSLQLFETWNGTLNPGQFLPYTFTGQTLITPGTEICCVQAQRVYSALGDSAVYETICVPLINTFTVLDPYPNPSSGQTMIYFILPVAQKVEFRLSDNLGNILRVDQVNGVQGVNQYILDMSHLAAGGYHLAVYYQDQRIQKPLIKL